VLNPQTHTQELSTGRNRWHQQRFLEKQWHQPNLQALRELVARTRPALLELAEAVGLVEAEATWPRVREAASALWDRRGFRQGLSGEQCRARELGFIRSGPRRVERELQVLRELRAKLAEPGPPEPGGGQQQEVLVPGLEQDALAGIPGPKPEPLDGRGPVWGPARSWSTPEQFLADLCSTGG
jgi:hypothetical protein